MKKKLFATLVLAVAGLVGSAAFAQKAEAPACQNESTPTCNTKKMRQACADSTCKANPFEGLNLSDEQKGKLKALRTECRTNAGKAKEESRRQHLAKIKEILSPEQYVQFLENSFVKGKKEMRRDADKMRRHHGDRKSDRPVKRHAAPADCPAQPTGK